MNKIPGLASPPAEETETASALKRLLNSERLRKNSSLRNLLEYLVTRTLRGEQSQIKESTVAMDVFGRPQDFDSRVDNIVRVQAHRLRKLLASYYETEGAGERIRFSIPRGGYIPLIEDVATLPEEQAGGSDPLVVQMSEGVIPVEAPIATPALPAHRRYPLSLALAFLSGVLVCLAFFALVRFFRPEPRRAPGVESAASGVLKSVWGTFLTPGVNCVVSYSNPVFLATGRAPGPRVLIPYRGLLSMPAGARLDLPPSDLNITGDQFGRDPEFTFSDGWTGVGEVAAMQRITALLSPEVSLRVLRSRALSYSDIKDSNVIFLGSPWANEMQKKINVGPTPLMNDNEGNIVNVKPQSGEPARFRAQTDPANQQMISTYGLFSVLPGIAPGTKVIISAGVNTYGTQGAMDFMTRSTGIEEAFRLLKARGNLRAAEYFQAVVRSEMIRGEPERSRLVLVREVAIGGSSTVH